MVAGVVAAVTLLAGTGAALAHGGFGPFGGPGGGNQTALLNDVAARLNVSGAALRKAVKDTVKAQVDQQVKDGLLTKAEGDKIKERVDNGAVHVGVGPAGVGDLGIMQAAAAYLGRTGQARRWARAASAVVPDHAASDVYAAALEALLDAWGGRLRAAHQRGTLAVALAAQSGLPAHPEIVLAQLALATVAREQDRLDEAARRLDEAAVLLERGAPCALLGVHAAETALLALARCDPDAGLEALLGHRARRATPPPAVAARLAAAEARVLASTGDLASSAQALERAPLVTPEVAGVAIRIAIEQDDLRRASSILDSWPGVAEPGPALQRTLWLCIVEDLDGRDEAAQQRMPPLVAAAQEEGHVRLFVDAGHHALRLVRTLYHGAPSPYLRRLVDSPIPPPLPDSRPVPSLVEQFSNRERAVLRYLPSRLSNAEIATQLRISINTVKTHLKHIYRKLGVDGRRDAITAAERLHLL